MANAPIMNPGGTYQEYQEQLANYNATDPVAAQQHITQAIQAALEKHPTIVGNAIERPEFISGMEIQEGAGGSKYFKQQGGLSAKYDYDPTAIKMGYNPEALNWQYQPEQLQSAYDDQYMGRIWDEATAETPSWLQGAYGQQDLLKSQNIEAAQKSSAAALAKARADMAMRGGARSGTANMLARMGARDLNQTLAGVRSQDALTRAGLGQQSAQMQQNMMMQLPGMEAQRAGMANQLGMFNVGEQARNAAQDMATQQFNVGQQMSAEQMRLANEQFNEQQRQAAATGRASMDQYNKSNLLNQLEQLNRAELAAYDTEMQTWAANQQANATQAAGGGGGGGCFITTAVCNYLGLDDDNEILNAYRRMRDEYARLIPELNLMVADYYTFAPTIVEKIEQSPDKDEIYKEILHTYLIPGFKLIKESTNYDKASQLYIEMVKQLKETFISGE